MKFSSAWTLAWVVTAALSAGLGAGCAIRPYDPLTDVPRPLFGEGPLNDLRREESPPAGQGASRDSRDLTVESLERRLGIGAGSR